eukprot:2732037-Pyramimonas_sp.AAC.1
MPLSRSPIPLCCLMHAVFDDSAVGPGVVQVSFPLNVRGESVLIVHCVRHRRTVRAEDQYS